MLAEKLDKVALRKIAEDENNEGRVRAIAYNRLRAAGDKVPSKKLLGVIVEVPLQQGLDVLAAFSEGGVRYLNQSGKVAIFEGQGNPVEGLAKELVSASQPVVNQIGPWEKQRLPPPKAGNVRMTFLVSDGLYQAVGVKAAAAIVLHRQTPEVQINNEVELGVAEAPATSDSSMPCRRRACRPQDLSCYGYAVSTAIRPGLTPRSRRGTTAGHQRPPLSPPHLDR